MEIVKQVKVEAKVQVEEEDEWNADFHETLQP